MRDQRTWLRRIDVGLALAVLAAVTYAVTQLPAAGAWGWGAVAALGTTVAFAIPVAVVFGRRAHQMLLESPVLIPAALLLPVGTAVAAAASGIALGTWLRARREGRRDGTELTLRTVAVFLPAVALQAALAAWLAPTGGELVLAAILLEAVHVAVVLPVPLLRAQVNAAPRRPSRWSQVGPSLAVAPLAALTAGAVALLLESHGAIGLAGYAPVLLLLAGGHRLSEAQQDRRRLDALYGLALDTADAGDAEDSFVAAATAASLVLTGADVRLQDEPGRAGEVAFELAHGRWLVASRAADDFTPDDRDLLAAVGRLATTSAHRAVLHRELERQERVKTALLAAAGHDLQTPLAVQQGIADTLAQHRHELDAEQVEDLLGRIATNARRMSRTIRGLVDLERLELSGDEDGGCDAAATISQWAAQVDLPNGRFVQLEVTDEGRTPVALEPIHLERVVDNLAANASRYSPREEPITVRVARQGDHVLVAVEDRGSGVPESDRERIFEALDQGTSRVRGSVGLGLFIVSRLVEHGDGAVTVRDRDGGGASFQVHLPVRRGDDPADGAPTSDPGADQDAVEGTGGGPTARR